MKISLLQKIKVISIAYIFWWG